ncbi:MAG: hypothetical protein KGS72_20805 [Cyanobacteria bacterium REEB67]|nr:hypothetical protein [Cyanobacteria bacterium REEB67]
MSRLVKTSQIMRVARGHFVRAGSELPTTIKVVQTKASAFGRRLATHAKSLAEHFGLIPPEDTLPLFGVSSGTSSFKSMGVRSTLKKVCDRKSKLNDSPEGRTALAFWNLGKERFTAIADEDFRPLLPQEPVELLKIAYAMPAWMTDRLVKMTWAERFNDYRP